jgi:hypothetical protein
MQHRSPSRQNWVDGYCIASRDKTNGKQNILLVEEEDEIKVCIFRSRAEAKEFIDEHRGELEDSIVVIHPVRNLAEGMELEIPEILKSVKWPLH